MKLFFFLALSSVLIFPQGKGSLRGFVSDSTNGEPLSYVTVAIQNTKSGSTTNTQGYFFVPGIPEGNHTAVVSFMGYQTKYIDVKIKRNEITQVNVEISPSTLILKELSVIGKSQENESDLGLQKITPREIELLPQGLESDIFRFIQQSSGVSSTGDVTSRYFVRGGASDQNLLMLNNVPIYNPYHALGIFSVIDPEAISVMEFYKGGFPAEHGGRLSSIVNVITKDGNKYNYAASANASFISGKASVEGPIPYGSFVITARKSYFTEILKKYLNNKEAPFDFYDASIKLNFADSKEQNTKFIVHSFISNDALNGKDQLREDYVSKNKLFGLNWHQVWGSPLFSNTSVNLSNFYAEVFPNLSKSKPRRNDVNDFSLNSDFIYVYESKDEFRFGAQSNFIKTDLTLENVYGQKVNHSRSGGQFKGYANYKFLRFDDFGFDIGGRINFLTISGKGPFFIEPRLNFIWRPTNLISLKAAAGRYSQEVVSLTNENEIISLFEPWVIVPEYLNPPEANHLILGAEFILTEHLSLNLETYYKYLTNLIDINERKYSFKDRDYINVSGRAYGAEVNTKYANSFISFQAAYSLGYAFKMKDDKDIIPRYDIRHNINLQSSVDLGADWNFNASWTFNSGMPFTPIAGFYDRLEIDPLSNDPRSAMWGNLFFNYDPVTLWAERNNSRLTYYHRMDISLNKSIEVGFAKFSIGASIINVYNRKNIFYFHKDTGEKVYMLPFLPSLTVKAEL